MGMATIQMELTAGDLMLPADVPLGFWKDWSKLVKSVNPHAIIVAELWELSPDFISRDWTFRCTYEL